MKMLWALFFMIASSFSIVGATEVMVSDPGQPAQDGSLDGAYTIFTEVTLTSDDPLQDEEMCLEKIGVKAVATFKDGSDPSNLNLADYLGEICVALNSTGKVIARRPVNQLLQGNIINKVLKVPLPGYLFQRSTDIIVMGVPKGLCDGNVIITLSVTVLKFGPSKKDQTKVKVVGLPIIGTSQEGGLSGTAPRVLVTWRKTINSGKLVQADAPDGNVNLQRCILGPDKNGLINQSATLATIVNGGVYPCQWDAENRYQWYDIGVPIAPSEVVICIDNSDFFKKYKFRGGTGFVFTDNAGHRLIPQ